MSQKPRKECPPDHFEYLSEMLANNAVTLHMMIHPGCESIASFPCKDHWHIGHPDAASKEACPKVVRPVFPRAVLRRSGRS